MKPAQRLTERRRLTLLAASAALIGGLGCASTVVVGTALKRTPDMEGDVVLTDTILAYGVPGPELTKKIDNPQAMAFIGQQKTYLLVKGGDELMRIARELPPQHIVLFEDSRRLFLKDDATWGSLGIRYEHHPPSPLSADEQARLTNLGFTKEPGVSYYKRVAVEGKVYPALAIPSNDPHQFTLSRKLVFRKPPIEGGHPNLANLALLPASLAVDVVTAPLQLIGFLMLR